MKDIIKEIRNTNSFQYNFNAAKNTYLSLYNELPTNQISLNHNVYYDIFMDNIKRFFPKYKIINKESYVCHITYNIIDVIVTIELEHGYLMEISSSFKNDDGFVTPTKEEKNSIRLCGAEIFYNKENSKLLNNFAECSKLSKIIEKNIPSIHMISYERNYYIRQIELDKKINIKRFDSEMDFHYGDGFSDFHKELIKKLKNQNKGLVLLHGEPGTGKTYYIRRLIYELSIKNKAQVLMIPSNMINFLLEPTFFDIMLKWCTTSDNKIVVIEDAEPLLESREGGRNLGVSNLLNMTDGILNDIFGIKVIATFNTSISKIDSALLRNERLIAKKEFTKLNLVSATKLANKLSVDINLLGNKMIDFSLSDIYSIKNKTFTINHGIKEKEKMGFKI